jgi:glyoxylase I family protein
MRTSAQGGKALCRILPSMALEVLGIDHLYVTVSDLTRSEQFYDPILRALGFRKGTLAVGGEPHIHYFNRVTQYSLRQARLGVAERAEPYRTGSVHHLCFRVRSAAHVDQAQRMLRALGVEASEPRVYAEYIPDYYATFFSDPDGIRLEIVCETELRRVTRQRWAELTEFVNPVRRLLEREARAADKASTDADEHVSRDGPGSSVTPAEAPGNLWRGVSAPASGELFEKLAEIRGTIVERIVSSESASSELQDQPHAEWVVLLRGEAALEVEGKLTRLSAGDYLLLPAHAKHRVLETSREAVWLAVHVT